MHSRQCEWNCVSEKRVHAVVIVKHLLFGKNFFKTRY